MAGITATADPATGKVSLDIQMTDTTITKVNVGRVGPTGIQEIIRRGDQAPSPGGHVAMNDFECPLDVPVYYVATQALPTGSEQQVSTTVTLASNGYAWLKDPGYPSLNFRIPIVTSIESLTRAARSGKFSILDRVNPIVVSAKRQGAEGTLVLHTLTDSERYSLLDLLARGTTLLLQTASYYGFGTEYVWVGDVEEIRLSVAQAPERRWTLPFTVVDRPKGITAQPAVPNTWADVKAKYTTWADLAATGKTWGQLLEEGV